MYVQMLLCHSIPWKIPFNNNNTTNQFIDCLNPSLNKKRLYTSNYKMKLYHTTKLKIINNALKLTDKTSFYLYSILLLFITLINLVTQTINSVISYILNYKAT